MRDSCLHALEQWQQRCPLLVRWSREYASSCAQFHLRVAQSSQGIDDCVRALGELLRVVELLTRPGVATLALRRLSGSSDTSECPMGQRWCSFCDGADRRVVLTLLPGPGPHSFLEIVRRAVFEWRDDGTATQAFRDLYDAPSFFTEAKRSRAVELSVFVEYSGDKRVDRDLRLLLDCHATQSEPERQGDPIADPLIRIAALDTYNLNHAAMSLIAASQLPIEVTKPDDWRVLVKDERGLIDGASSGAPTLSILARSNVTKLHVDTACNDDMVGQLLLQLASHATQLKQLRFDLDGVLEYGDSDGADSERVERMQAIGHALFGPDSTLRLDLLTLTTCLCERDLVHMIALFDPSAAARDLVHMIALFDPSAAAVDDKRMGNARHRSVALRGCELSTIRGATLGRLLTLSGGVESLALRHAKSAGLGIAEIPSLVGGCRSLRSLKASITCHGWEELPEASEGSQRSTLSALELFIEDRDPALVARAVERLLGHLGRSLLSLSLLLRRRSTALSPHIAAIIAEQCPNLQQLSVRNAPDSFVLRLVDGYQKRPCSLKQLCFLSGDADATYDDLIAALSLPSHRITRSLRSLRIDVRRRWRHEAISSLSARLQQMLQLNQRLRDVAVVAFDSQVRGDPIAVATTSGRSGVLPPLRHRLAAIGVLHRLALPAAVMAGILFMAARPVDRFRLYQTPDNGAFHDSDEEVGDYNE
ncbi:hypothetical protein ATCC90586_008832 [Pythium insidiosum]|nr:hypothetical protein ATCC90586_008832 [Pythium insidiosum]